MKVTERSRGGFRGIWPTGPRRGALGAQHTHFQGPSLMRHTIDAYDARGFANVTAVYAVPMTPGRARAIVRQPFRFKNKLFPVLAGLAPTFLGHLGNNSVLDEDNRFLHLQACCRLLCAASPSLLCAPPGPGMAESGPGMAESGWQPAVAYPAVRPVSALAPAHPLLCPAPAHLPAAGARGGAEGWWREARGASVLHASCLRRLRRRIQVCQCLPLPPWHTHSSQFAFSILNAL